jgi:hypothetical protein
MFFNSENAAAEGLWKKTHGAKVQKTDFLTVLGNPAKPAGLPLFPQPRLLLISLKQDREFQLSLSGKND